MQSPQIVGRYAIHEKIASGGMASVHFGRSLGAAGFARTVAIKRLHAHLLEQPDFTAMLLDEARLAARIHNPNVVPVLDVVSAEDELLVVMEYVRGESLSRLLQAEHKRRGVVSPPIASAIAIGALAGLHAAHEATSERGTPLEIVHRDVSPQNILVGIDGVARVIDFGIAKAADRLHTTHDGSIKGKRAYMAPEQIVGGEVTRRTDVYALSVVLWETLTCQRLFEGDANVVRAVLCGATVPPSRYAPDVPSKLDAIVMKGLALDAADRFSTALEMADALQRVVPPAFATQVGAWVQEVAGARIEKHAALLAAIESGADAPSCEDTALENALTVASQPSSVSVATPMQGPPIARRSRSRVVSLASAGAAAVVVAVVALLAGRRSVPSPAAQAPASAMLSAPLPVPVAEEAAPEAGISAAVSAEPPSAPLAPPSSRPHASPAPPRPITPRRPPSPAPPATSFDPASVR
jgi:serine/threonine-protein kinase